MKPAVPKRARRLPIPCRLVAVLCALLLGACATQPNPHPAGEGAAGWADEPWLHPPVPHAGADFEAYLREGRYAVLLGVVVNPGTGRRIDRSEANASLVRSLRDQAGVALLPMREVYDRVGNARLARMLEHLARHKVFTSEQVQTLMAANLPPRALVIRIDENDVEQLPREVDPNLHVRNAFLNDRERTTLNTRRTVEATATVLDLRQGVVVWQRVYQAAPVNTRIYDRYLGHDVGSSLAASVANTMVNGVKEPAWPPAPPFGLAFSQLALEVARSAPLASAPGRTAPSTPAERPKAVLQWPGSQPVIERSDPPVRGYCQPSRGCR